MKFALVHEGFKHQIGVDMQHIHALDPYWNKKEITVTCGRNDCSAFQLALLSHEPAHLSLGTGTAFSQEGDVPLIRLQASIDHPGIHLSLYHEQAMLDETGYYRADVLHETASCPVERDLPKMVWIGLKTDAAIPAGTYQGTLSVYTHRMFAPETLEETLSFTVQVKNVVLPEPQNYTFFLDLWQHNSNIARKHEVDLWSDAHFNIIEGYVKTLADLGQKSITVIASEIPWSGQGCFHSFTEKADLYEYSMIQVKRDDTGTFSYDYSAMQRYIDLCFQYHIDKEIEIFGLVGVWTLAETGFGAPAADYPDAVRIRYYDEPSGTYRFMDQAFQIKDYISHLEQYLLRHGLMEKAVLVADEPADLEKFRASLEIIHACAPAFEFKAAINHVEFIEEFQSDLVHLVPNLPFTCEKLDFLQNLKRTSDKTICWYVCCGPSYPNTFLSSPLAECRFIPLLNYFLGLDGFLRWNYTVWPNDPRHDIRYRLPIFKTGDTNFVYPSYGGAPILTLRYMLLKRGIMDFELLKLAESKCPEAIAPFLDCILKTKDMSRYYQPGVRPEDLYSLEYEDYIAAKNRLLDALEKTKQA